LGHLSPEEMKRSLQVIISAKENRVTAQLSFRLREFFLPEVNDDHHVQRAPLHVVCFCAHSDRRKYFLGHLEFVAIDGRVRCFQRFVKVSIAISLPPAKQILAVEVREIDTEEPDPKRPCVKGEYGNRQRGEERDGVRNQLLITVSQPCFQGYQNLAAIHRQNREQVEDAPADVYPKQIEIDDRRPLRFEIERRSTEQQDQAAEHKSKPRTRETDGHAS